ncbi:putative Ig domain-containing protein [Zobellia uliginosa]|uniref:putative Ig domain-containing protein n=1 Tax=Zobellia uliginosa TaxID=143224 RepID=UPI0026E440DD|nr:putative Ig domain-containing protein [Zobellia uliginosa]MDO6517969.1 hypothetical protein [Zobellia uliginosa]
MTNTLLSFIFILGFMGCTSQEGTVDYLNQNLPGATPVIFAPGIVSVKGRFEHGISFTPDTRQLAFGTLNPSDFGGSVFYSEKISGKWTPPEMFKPLENRSVFLPYFTPDGESLLYAQSIADTNNLYMTDIWRIKQENGNWGIPKKMHFPINSTSREANASMTYDGSLYFSSNRNCQGKENCYTADLFYSTMEGNTYQSTNAISELNSSNDEESVFISPKEDYILFCRYTDDDSFVDLYISYRDYRKQWTPAAVLDAPINSKDWDRRPFVSIDNKLLFFTRLQIGEKGLTESDIYWANTSKVFKPFVFRPQEDITVPLGEKFSLTLPSDYFKDIDSDQLVLGCNQDEFDWLTFDNKNMTLSGVPADEGDFELTFTAVDEFMNRTEDNISISVTK